MTDYSIGPVGQVNSGSQISKKPSYLIVLEYVHDELGMGKFITLDKIEYLPGFIQAKGFFSSEDEPTIVNNFQSLLSSVDKSLICEMIFPAHKILHIRSLIYNAIKTQTLVK